MGPITLDEVNSLFLPLPEHPQDRHVRGLAWAVAQDWAVRLPDRAPQKAAAIRRLVDAADLACEALTAAR